MTVTLACPKCAAIGLAAVFILVLGGSQAAQADDPVNKLALEAYGYYLSDIEFDDGGAKYDMTRSGLKATYSYFRFVYDRMDFNWDDNEIAKLPFGNGKDDPWESLQRLEIGANYQGKFNHKWSYAVDGALFSAFEKDIKEIDSRLQAWAGYGFNPDLRLRFGARAYIYAFQVVALPVLSLDYRWDQQEGFSANLGFPETHLRYGFNKYVALRLFGEYEHHTYRLADDSEVEEEGYLQREGVMTGLVVDLTPVKNLCISAGVIRSLDYTLTTYDKDGDNEKDYDNESGWGAIVRVNYAF